MDGDPLDRVLRLVAEGRLTAEEAAPILAALEESTPATAPSSAHTGRQQATSPDPAASRAFTEDEGAGGPSQAPSSLRIEVRDKGRSVVNLRLPIGVGRFALDRVPGLSGEQVDRVREAMTSGFRGPVMVVDDGDSGVRIVLE